MAMTDEEAFDLNKLKKEKQFAHIKELKVTFDYDGKIVPIKEPNLNFFKVIEPEIYID